MYVRSEDEYSILRHAEDITGIAFNWQIKDDEMTGFVNEDPYVIIDDLCSEVDRLREELEDTKDHYENLIEDCYKPISPYEFYGISESDFH